MKVAATSKKIEVEKKKGVKPSLEKRIMILEARIISVESLISSLFQGKDMRGLP